MEVTHARVKYRDAYDNNCIDFVKIENVKEFKKNLPKDKNDFDKGKYYTVNWTNPKTSAEIYLPAQICQLACGEDEKNELEKKRANFPKLSQTLLNEYDNQQDSDSESEPSNKDKEKVTNQIAKKELKKKVKEKEQQLNESILNEKLQTLVSSGLIYESADSVKQSNVTEKGLDNNKAADDIEENDDTVKNVISQLQNKILNYEKMIDEQNLTINKLKDDLTEKNNKIIALEEMNNDFLDNITASPARKSLFRSTSTPMHNINNLKDPVFPADEEATSGVFSLDGQNSNPSTSTSAIVKNSKKRNISGDEQSSKKLKSNLLEKAIDKHFKVKKKEKKKKSKKNKKKNNRKEKRKHKIDSEDDYESDQYSNLSNLPNMKSWVKEENDKKVKMMHLFFGVSITYDAWKDIRDISKPSMYIRKLSRAIWGWHQLMNRAINIKKVTRSLPNRSPRKPLTPVKKTVLRKMFFDFVSNNIAAKQRTNTRNQWKRILGDYINYLIKTEAKTISSSDASSSAEESEDSSSTNSNNTNNTSSDEN